MNNELKQILKNQLALLDVGRLIYDKEKRIKETIEILNLKEDVTYAESLKECECEHDLNCHPMWGKCNVVNCSCKKFVNSSINEKGGKK